MNKLRRVARAAGAPFRLLALILIKSFRFVTSGLAPRCRYYPSCSAYAEDAIRSRGIIVGCALAAWRLLRCNPFSKGGIDHVRHSHTYDDVIRGPLLRASR